MDRPTDGYTLPLDDERADLRTVGGKGAALARMSRAGLPVPTGFFVTTAAYDEFVAVNGLADRILDALRDLDALDPVALERASTVIGSGFEAAPTPPPVATAIATAYAGLGEDAPVAVRSSATAEDLAEASFAGQHETFLGVRTRGDLDEAVRRCWASLFTARAIGYRARRGIDPQDVRLAVVVQCMVPADAAGVLFTANPANGRRTEAVLNAAWGLGESVVRGSVNPDTVVVERATGRVLRRDTGDKATMTVAAGRGVEERSVAADQRRREVLSTAEAGELASLGTRCEELFGAPQDIEWARADGAFLILQSRPITDLGQPMADPPTEWPVPDPRMTYYRASIIEQLPDPLSPLFADLAATAVPETLFEVLDEFLPGAWERNDFALELINGYAYLSIRFPPRAVWALTVRMWPLIPWLFREALPRWRTVGLPRYRERTDQWGTRRVEDCAATELVTGAADLLHAGAQYYTSVQAVIPLAQLEVLFGWFYDRFVRREQDPPRQAFLLGFDSVPLRADKSLFDLAAWSRAHEALARALSATPAGEVDRLLHAAAPPDGVDRKVWTAWQASFRSHLERYGHILYNLDFLHPVPVDEPAPLFATFRLYLAGEGTDPHERQRRLAERREEATSATQQRLDPVRRAIFRLLLRSAQRYLAPREDALADVGLGWPTLRRLLAELGRRLAAAGTVEDPDDVYWLELAEVQAAAEALDAGRTDLASRAEAVLDRQMRWRGQRRAVPPPVLPPGARMLGLDLTRWMPAREEQRSTGAIEGVGTSGGVATGTARVLSGPEDFSTMQPGDVLVAAITTPAWTPLFAMASAVVTDIGGPLSHSSIVAREYDIPGVAATGIATRTIRSGQTVRVDGDAGVVTVLDGTGSGEAAHPLDTGASQPRRRRRAVAAVLGAVALASAAWWNRRRFRPCLLTSASAASLLPTGRRAS